MRCQARLDFTSETRFRSGAERNIEQQMINTTLCYFGSNPISDGFKMGIYLKRIRHLWIQSIWEI
jgi:hypothetical protein